MKQVNFVELIVETEIDKYESLDMSHRIGNAIHQQAINVPMSELARRIYYSEGAININDEDYVMMLTIVRKSFALVISKAIEQCTVEVVEEKEVQDDKVK